MFRDGRPQCPSCVEERALVPDQRTRLACEHCRGVFVPTAEVEDMVSQLRVEPFTLPAGVEGERTCPRCTSKLARIDLFGFEVDHCGAHGVWFDGKELTSVLEAASGVDPRRIETGAPVSGGLGVFRALFGSRYTLPWSPRRPPDDK